MIKVWHDDVRPAPEGWVWARNNDEAIALLESEEVDTISLDHDLGADPSEGVFAKGSAEITGLHLVEWMVTEGVVPPTIIIHSWNIPGARRMESVLLHFGYQPRIDPYYHVEAGNECVPGHYRS